MTGAITRHRVEVAIIGAGPAGASAAIALAEAGREVLLIDEAAQPGGRIWRAPASALRGGNESAEIAEGDRLRVRLSAAKVSFMANTVVWSIGRTETGDATDVARGNGAPRFRIDALTPAASLAIDVRSVLVAIGTTERIIPFPGWTIPGVIGLAATTILLKSQRMAPGQRVVVAGTGPLLASVAAGVLKVGAEVAAVVDLAGPGDWLAALPALAREPQAAARGAGWLCDCLRAGVRPRFRSGVMAAEGEDRLKSVILGPVDSTGAPVPASTIRRVACDALAIGHGLAPATEVTRLLRADHVFDRDLGGWRPDTDSEGRTSLPGLYVAGDGAGLRGATYAIGAGSATGDAIARDLEGIGGRRSHSFASQVPLGRAMGRLIRQRPAMSAAIAPDTVICRCEDVTREEIEAAITNGAREINQLKHFTRCGMGPCQGRVCGEVAAEILALHLAGPTGDIDSMRRHVGQWTGRAPLRPVPLDTMIGDFTYDDIPVPEPAPL